MAIKKKNALEETLNFVGNIAGGAVKNTQSFLNNFNQGYNNFQKQNAAVQQQGLSNAANFTKNIISGAGNTAQQTGKTFLDYFNSGQASRDTKGVLRGIGQGELDLEKNVVPYGQLQRGIRSTVAPIVANFNPKAAKTYQGFSQAEAPGFGNKAIRFAGEQIPYIPLVLATEGLINPVTSRAAAALPAVTEGMPLATRILLRGGAGAIKLAPTFGAISGLAATNQQGVPYTPQQRLQNVGLGAATGTVAGLGGAAFSQIAGDLVAKYGTEAENFLVNKDIIRRVLMGGGTPEEQALVKRLNNYGLAPEAARAEGGLSVQIEKPKDGYIWNFLRKAFPQSFDAAGKPNADFTHPEKSPLNALMVPEEEALGSRLSPVVTPEIPYGTQPAFAPAFRTPTTDIPTVLGETDIAHTGNVVQYNNEPQTVLQSWATSNGEEVVRIQNNVTKQIQTVPISEVSPANTSSGQLPTTENSLPQPVSAEDIIGPKVEQSPAAQMLKADIDQALQPDTKGQIVDAEANSTAPIPSDSNTMTKENAEVALKSLLSDKEIKLMGLDDIKTPEGKPAEGRYYDAVIQAVQKNGLIDRDTLNHEIFHAYQDKFADPKLYGEAINEASSQWFKYRIPGVTSADELLAEGFADPVLGKMIAPKGSAIRALYDDLTKGRGVGEISRPSGIQVGITSAQPANPVTASILEEGTKLFEAGDVNNGLAKLQEATQVALPELQQLLSGAGVDVRRLETGTHGLYFGTPEPSYWLNAGKETEDQLVRSVAQFAKNHNQESFITSTRSNSETAKPGLTIRFNEPLDNVQVLSIEKIANDAGIGLTLNQGTGEAKAFNIQMWDELTPEQFIEASAKIKENLAQAGFGFDARLDNYDTKVYNSDTYDTVINQGINGTVQPGQQVGDARRLDSGDIAPQFKTTRKASSTTGAGSSTSITPSTEWQEVPADVAVPIGGEFKIEDGKQYVRYPKDIAKENANIIKDEKSPTTKTSATISNPQDPFYNVNRVGVSKKVKQAIKETIESPEVKDAIEKTVGIPMTFKEVKTAAKTSPELNTTKTREATLKLGAQAQALRNKVAELSGMKGLSKEGFEEALIKDKAFGSFLARLLGQRRIVSNPEDKTLFNEMVTELVRRGKDPDKLLEAAKGVDFNNNDEAIKFYRSFVKPNLGDWLAKVRYNSMLSGVTTQLVNLSSNIQGTAGLAPVRMTIEGGLDAAASGLSKLVGKERARTRYAGEGIAYVKSYFSPQVLSQAKNNLVSVLKGDTLSTNPDVRLIPLTTSEQPVAHFIEGTLDSAARVLEGTDQWFEATTKAGFEGAYNYRQSKGIKMDNLKGQARTMADRELFRQQMVEKGRGIVSGAVGEFANNIYGWTKNKNPLVRIPASWSMPFVRIATNLTKSGLEGSALGAVNLVGHDDKIEQIAKLIMGATVTGIATTLALHDRLVAAEPTDPTQKAAFRASGLLPWSITVDTAWGKQSVQFKQMHPIVAFQLGMVAAAADSLKKGEITEDTAANVLGAIASAQGYVSDQSYMKSLGDFIGSFSGNKAEAIPNLASNYINQLIPFKSLMSYVNRVIDPYQRKPDAESDWATKTIQTVISTIPGLSGTVPARLGPDGKPIENKNRTFNAISPYRTSPISEQGAEDYGNILLRTKTNQLVNKLTDTAKKEKDALDTRSYDEKAADNRDSVKADILRNQLKLNGGAASVGDKVMYFDNKSGEVKTIDMSKFSDNKPGIGKFEQEQERYKSAREVYNSSLPEEQKQALFTKLGVDTEGVRYDVKANFSTEIKTNYIIDKAGTMSHEDLLNELVKGRLRSISDKIFANDETISGLVREGVLSAEEGKYLKNVDFNKKGELINSGGSGKKKSAALKIDLPEIKYPSTKLNLGAGLSKAMTSNYGTDNGLIYKGRTAKFPKFTPRATSKSTGFKSGISLNLRPMTTTLGGLGRV